MERILIEKEQRSMTRREESEDRGAQLGEVGRSSSKEEEDAA